MSFNSRQVTNYQPKSGTFNTLVAGSIVGAGSIDLHGNKIPAVKTLSALVDVTSKTSGLTIAIRWQVSDNGSTWEDVLLGGQDVVAALTDLVLVTGNGTGVEKKARVSAPDAVYGSRYSRIAFVTGGATSANAADVYSTAYQFMDRTKDHGAQL